MNGAFFVLAITIALTSVKAVAFFAVARLDRANRTAIWFAVAFAFAALSSIGELALAFSIAEPVTRMVIAVSILVTLVLVAHGLAARYGVALALPGSLAIIVASTVLFFLILDLPREDVVRQGLYQLPYALASLLSAWVLTRVHTKRALEWIMIALFVILALQFMAKPLIAQMTGGVGATPGSYIFTQYAAISQTSGAILLLVLALGATALVVRDSAGALIARAERDTMTGLFTQNGFEGHAGRAVRAASGHPLPDMGLILIAGHGNPGPADIEKARARHRRCRGAQDRARSDPGPYGAARICHTCARSQHVRRTARRRGHTRLDRGRAGAASEHRDHRARNQRFACRHAGAGAVGARRGAASGWQLRSSFGPRRTWRRASGVIGALLIVLTPTVVEAPSCSICTDKPRLFTLKAAQLHVLRNNILFVRLCPFHFS